LRIRFRVSLFCAGLFLIVGRLRDLSRLGVGRLRVGLRGLRLIARGA
jgi:hypothetical protein